MFTAKKNRQADKDGKQPPVSKKKRLSRADRRQIEAFTEKNSNFEIIYQKQFLPTQDVDGFYICKMLKKG